MANGEVGDLKVKLSLDNAQFERSIASMNRTLKAMGQELRGLQNKGKAWGSSLDGLKQKQEAYGRMLQSQQTLVRKLADEYEKAKSKYGEHSAQAEKLAVQLNKASAEMERTERELSEITAELKEQEAALKKSQSSWNKFGEVAKSSGEKLKSVGEGMKNVGKEMTLKITAPLTALGIGATKAAIDFESAFAGVRKTVNTSEEGFKKLEKGILEMSRTLPASASDIAAVAESAGQLGIAEENILSFTKTIIDLGESTNLTAEQGASEFARFANIVGMSQSDFDRLGSSIVALGNTMATTESEIMSMAMRLAAQGSQVGMTEAQILALSGTMSSLGIEAEAGGTAMTTVLKKMQDAVSNGGKDLEAFAEAARMSTTEFADLFKKDAASALDTLIKGLAQSTSEGANLNSILEAMGIKGIREADTMLRLAGAADLLSNAVETSGKAWEENSALSNEAEQRYATTASQLAMLKNRLVEVGISLGQVLLPFLIKIVELITPIITKFAEMDSKMQGIILIIGAIVAAIGPMIIIIGTLISSIGSIVGVIGTVSAAIASAGGVMAALSGALAPLGAAFTALTGPIGITIAAVVGIGTALTVAYKKVEWFRNGVNSIFTAIKNTVSPIFNAIKSTIVSLITSAVNLGKSVLDKFKVFWNENGQTIMSIVKTTFNTIKTVITSVLGIIKGIFQAVWPVISSIVKVAFGVIQTVIKTVLDVILGIIGAVLKVIKGDWKGAWDSIKNIFVNIWNNIKDFFKSINLIQIGKDIINGLINGIKSMASAVWDTVKSIASGIGDAIKGVLGINSPSRVTTELGKHTGQGLANGIASKNKEVTAASKKLAATAIKNLETKFDTSKISAREYIKDLQKLSKQYQLTADQKNKIDKEIYAANKTIQKQEEERKKKIESINTSIVKANQTYLDKVKSINKQLKSDIKELKDDYNKQLADLTNSIYNSVGLFSKIESKNISGSELLNNLQTQNKQFKQWQSDLEKLEKRGIAQSLLDELRAMGVSSASEINAIANMTNNELNQYVKAWKEKNALAKKEATTQMSGAKKQLEDQIRQLTAAANKELDKANTTWKNTINKLGNEIKKLDAFKESGKMLGKNTINGLISGIKSMTGPLEKEMKSLAKTVEKSIKSALKIKSPSRVMMEVGKFTGQGLAVGLENSIAMVKKAANSLATVTTDSMNYGLSGSQTSYDYSKSFAPVVHINTTNSGTNEMERVLRKMAFQF